MVAHNFARLIKTYKIYFARNILHFKIENKKETSFFSKTTKTYFPQITKSKSGVVIKCLKEGKLTNTGIQRGHVIDATKRPWVNTLCLSPNYTF